MAESQMTVHASGAIEKAPSKRRVGKLARSVLSLVPGTSAFRTRRAKTEARRQAERGLLLEQARAELEKARDHTPFPLLAELLDVGKSQLIYTDPVEVSAGDLENFIEKGREALVSLMIEKGVPQERRGDPYRGTAAQKIALLKHKLVSSGIMNDVTIETLKEDLARDNIPLVERASNLLAGMVLDKEVYYARVRQKALVALMSASVFSNESREMLQKFGFTIEIINEAASALSSQSERAADSRRIQKKSWVLFIVGAGGAIVSVATGMTGLPLVVSAVGAGLGFFGEPIFGRRAKRSKEKEGQICNSALNQADQFHRLLTEHQRTALPAHE